ncbi:MAG TPA: alpha/beta hydrolase [Gammaproteobacteria bacterium]|nr:alpha/beta hydrolase [Gammaproteobacteria bacterium]
MKIISSTLKVIAKALSYGTVGALLVLVTVFVIYLDSRPDLDVWHEADLDEEYTADSDVKSFSEYLDLEKRLFEQLDEKVYAKTESNWQQRINRYHKGSLADPGRWPQNWNRSFELTTANPRAGILLLHGLSDSPYSMRSLGESLHAHQALVVGLRIPGHGTAPSGLVEVRWQDMAAAVKIAMRHLKNEVGDQPIYIVGYSNGGALAVHYALESLTDEVLPRVSGVALLSPSIGVTKVAPLAVWQARLGHLLGLEKLAWSDILPEFEPFKYGSFAVNAGDLVYRLTSTIQSMIDDLEAMPELKRLPPILAFQSSVDATVSARAVIEKLFKRLPQGGHELVMFDINRREVVEEFLSNDLKTEIEALLTNTALPFGFGFVTNGNAQSSDVLILHKQAASTDIQELPLATTWPQKLYSLSHVALPFPANDPLYGGDEAVKSPGIKLGDLALRGETGVIQIPASTMLRLRWNPFYPYIERRVLEFTGLAGSTD